MPTDARRQKKAEDARARMQAAGVDPATIATFLKLILDGLPGVMGLIEKFLEHHRKPAPPTP